MTIAPAHHARTALPVHTQYTLTDPAQGMLEANGIDIAELYRLIRNPIQVRPAWDGNRRLIGYGITAVVNATEILAVGIHGADAETREEMALERAINGEAEYLTAEADRILAQDAEILAPRDPDGVYPLEGERAVRRKLSDLKSLTARTLTGLNNYPPLKPVAEPPMPPMPASQVSSILPPAQRPSERFVPGTYTFEPMQDRFSLECWDGCPDECPGLLHEIHPRLWRPITQQADGDLRRVVVYSRTNVEILPSTNP